MKIEYIAINGKLESMTKKEAKEKIVLIGYMFQQDINSKTTIVVNGIQPLKKKKQKIKELEKNGQIIKIITEEEFIELLNPKKSKSEVLKKIKNFSKKTYDNIKKYGSIVTNKIRNQEKEVTKSVKNKSKNITKKVIKTEKGLSNLVKENELSKKIKVKDEEIEKKLDDFKLPEQLTLKNILSLNTLRIVIAVCVIILGITKMITIPAKLVFLLGGLFIIPKISDKFLRHIIFKIVVPISLLMVAFSLNIETTLTSITGTWYSDTMTLKIGEETTEMDVIDSNGRHILKGKNNFDNGHFEIKTSYKIFRYEFDAMNDSLCVLNNDNKCRYYLDRVE